MTVVCHCPVVYIPPCNATHIRAGSLEPAAPVVLLFHEGTGILPESDSESSGTSTSTSSATSTSASSSSSSSSSTSSRDNYDTAMGWPIIEAVSLLYINRYLNECQVIKKCGSHLHITLHVWRTEQPENFQRHLCMWPEVFDALLSAICHDNIFSNSSNNKQIDLREQLSVALYRMGHLGMPYLWVMYHFGQAWGMGLWTGVLGAFSLCCFRNLLERHASIFHQLTQQCSIKSGPSALTLPPVNPQIVSHTGFSSIWPNSASVRPWSFCQETGFPLFQPSFVSLWAVCGLGRCRQCSFRPMQRV